MEELTLEERITRELNRATSSAMRIHPHGMLLMVDAMERIKYLEFEIEWMQAAINDGDAL